MTKAKGGKAEKGARRHGKPPFVPTDDQRRLVAGMASVRMSQEEMRQIIWNPHTNKPLGKSALIKHFRRELTEGVDKLRAVLGQRWLELIYSADDRVAWHAVEFGLKYMCGYNESTAPQVNIAASNGSGQNFEISFVAPSGKRLDLDALDNDDFDARPVQTRPLPPRQIEHVGNEHDSRRAADLRELLTPKTGKDWMR
jgi:hypothetical protein